MNRISMIVWNDFQNDARVRKEAETLQAAGHVVTVFALHTPGSTSRKETLRSGVKVVRVNRSPLWHLRRKRSGRESSTANSVPIPKKLGLLGQAVRLATRSWTHIILLARIIASRPDVVHSHDVNTLPTAWLAAISSRAPLIYDAHEISTDREGYAGFRRAVAFVERHLMPRAAGSITTTEMRAKFFARAYGVARPLVLQNRPRFSEVLRSDRIRSDLGLALPWPIVLYQGGLQQGRGLERLIDAATICPEAYFVFIGGGRLADALRTRVSTLGLEGRVHFIPTVGLEDLASYTASADIGVQPLENTCLNHYTTDSNKLFEYMMGGLAVVASDMPEIRRILQARSFGITFPPGDTGAMADAISTLVQNRKLRQTYRENARHAALIYNWEEQEDKLLHLYDHIIGRGKGTPHNSDRSNLLDAQQ
ncbi:glycosyltransferase family 4 protein [Nitratireductor sp. CH_MIT9313-5]|uniref:glycosyltransferase family 4 protein n=1 Tax=Nitratireductor sp. CH_MIT9313-5 TaxID=3107764 RepID=UPI0030086C49